MGSGGDLKSSYLPLIVILLVLLLHALLHFSNAICLETNLIVQFYHLRRKQPSYASYKAQFGDIIICPSRINLNILIFQVKSAFFADGNIQLPNVFDLLACYILIVLYILVFTFNTSNGESTY